jgi:hypothetical protein
LITNSVFPDADSKLARFVTVKAYEKASGSVICDLFDADSEGWLTDAELLNRLANWPPCKQS